MTKVYYDILNILFKIFAQSCTIRNVENGKSVFHRHFSLLMYSLTLCLLLIMHFISNEIIKLVKLDLCLSGLSHLSLLCGVFASFVNDPGYRACLDDILVKKYDFAGIFVECRRRPSFLKNVVCLCAFVVLCNLCSILVIIALEWGADFSDDSLLILVYFTVSLIHVAIFGKIILLIYELTDFVIQINDATKKFEPNFNRKKWRVLSLTYADAQEIFLRVNSILNPLLLVHIFSTFLKFHVIIYILTYSLATKWQQRNIIASLCFFVPGNLVNLFTISNLCHRLSNEYDRWWDIVEFSKNSMITNEIRRRKIIFSRENVPTVQVYNMINVNKLLTKVVLLAALSNAILVIQSVPNNETFLRS